MAPLLRVLTSAALSLIVACSEPTAPTVTFLHTDSTSYTAIVGGFSQVHVRLITTFQNPTDTLIKLERCDRSTPYPIYTVDLIAPASAEGAGYNPGWACVGISPFIVAAGAVRTDTITLYGPNIFDNTTHKFVGVLAGTFQISYGGQHSNEFTINVPPGIVP